MDCRTSIGLVAALLCVLTGCTYEPRYELTCTEEGAVVDGRRCEGGVWVSAADGGTTSDPDMGADGGDCSETAEQLCARLGFTCDEVTAEDACGEMRTVDCGTCRGQAECGGGGTPNVCACPAQSDEDFCRANGATCGSLTARDECGQMRTVPCGTCGDLADCQDNACVCDLQVACEQLDAACGDIDVDGRCGDETTLSCGACGDGATCQQNQCVCDDGYEPVADGCADVDECANPQVSQCDPNATCTNTPGGFTCECDPGFVGDGTTCEIPPLVDSVQEVVVTLPDGTKTATGTLANAVEIGQTVLFATQRNNGVNEADQMTVQVTMSAVNQIEVLREDAEGETTVVVYAVEFNPAVATVQGGSFYFNGSSDQEMLVQAVDPAKAFVVFNHSCDDNSQDKEDILVSGRLAGGGGGVAFDRVGNKGNVSGTYWVVEAVDDAFTVQHFVEEIPDGSAGNTTPITAVTPEASMLLYSYGSDLNNDDPDRTHVQCELQDATDVYCRRQNNSDTITDLALQVVSFGGDELVQRGTEEVVADLDQVTRSLDTPVDPAMSMAFGGQLGVLGITQLGSNNSTDTSAGFFTHQVVDGGQSVELMRGTPRDRRAFVSWQVMQW